MVRKITNKLMAWKKSRGRRPLILSGELQVGKTNR